MLKFDFSQVDIYVEVHRPIFLLLKKVKVARGGEILVEWGNLWHTILNSNFTNNFIDQLSNLIFIAYFIFFYVICIQKSRFTLNLHFRDAPWDKIVSYSKTTHLYPNNYLDVSRLTKRWLINSATTILNLLHYIFQFLYFIISSLTFLF